MMIEKELLKRFLDFMMFKVYYTTDELDELLNEFIEQEKEEHNA